MGKLIVFEGINGAGKSTVLEALAQIQTTSTISIRALNNQKRLDKLVISHPTSLGMFLAIIWGRVTWVRKLCKEYDVVLQDRAFLSEVTHLPNARRRINKWMVRILTYLYVPADLVVLLDTDPEVVLTRLKGRTEPSDCVRGLIDNPALLSERRKLFLENIKKQKGVYVTLSGNIPANVLAGHINEVVEKICK